MNIKTDEEVREAYDELTRDIFAVYDPLYGFENRLNRERIVDFILAARHSDFAAIRERIEGYRIEKHKDYADCSKGQCITWKIVGDILSLLPVKNKNNEDGA